MKKYLAIVILSVLCVLNCYSEGGTLEDNCGCGLGTILFEGHDGILSQTMAITTNGFFMNNFFGITSGSLGCEQPDSFVAIDRLNIFVAGNMDNLAKDIAMGKGETLSTLAEMMSVPDSDRANLYINLKNNFSTIYNSDTIKHQQVVKSILALANS